uniref:Uncharacterized protein n=1 Tax=viral metagenome TaxID=1070528 RepID=A0A6H2A3L3_9ZZZZ
MLEAVPSELVAIRKTGDFLSWLKRQPLDPEDKKLLLLAWCDAVGVPLTDWMVRETGLR